MNFINIFNALIIAVGPLCLWILKQFGEKATDSVGNYLEAKTASRYVGDLIKRVDDSALRIVKSVYMTYVENIKNKEERVLTVEEQAQAKSAAVEKLKSYLGPAGLDELSNLLGFSLVQREKYLSDGIEAAVYNLKRKI